MGESATIARRAMAALDRQDIGAFSRLCDPDVELYKFTARPDDHVHHDGQYALVPLRGVPAIEAWLREIFDAFPDMRFVLEDIDAVDESLVCDVRFSFGEDSLWPWTFVVTVYDGRIVGFEVFHPQVEGTEDSERHTVAWGRFQVRGRAGRITAPRACAWVYYKGEDGVATSMRVYEDKTRALAAVSNPDEQG